MSGLDRPWEMGEGHLIALINSVRETLTLDYKQSDALDKSKVVEISKDIFSFANSAGGTIIYGMEELDKTGYPKQIDGGVDPKKISAEWLNDIISSNIRPPLQGVRINPVSLDTLFPGKVAYVIYIPQSHDAHQAADKKYYRRQEFKSEPMYDHEIRDAMNRRQHPKIKPSVSFRLASDEDGKGWMIIGLSLLH